MDYTLVIWTPETGRTEQACATMTDVQNLVIDFIRTTTANEYVIRVVLNA